ncbi:MAG: serine hydrolase [Janthinobacterium lividum]
MLRRRSFLAVGLSTALVPGLAAAGGPDDDAIGAILDERIGAERRSVGMVAGVITEGGERRVVGRGRLDQSDPRVPDIDTVFEVGSITKVFTALLLADMALRGVVAWDEPVARLLPASVRVPRFGEAQITLLDLATHSSGLPRMPSNFHPADAGDPYADYTVAQLYDFLDNATLSRTPGTAYEYSNLGFGLLGHALSLRAGAGFEALVRARICAPLGLDSTAVTLDAGMRARLAAGHDAALSPVEPWSMPTLAGAAALRSTARDLLVFLSAASGRSATPLSPAFAALLDTRRPGEGPRTEAALGWMVTRRAGGEVAWKNGGTGGFSSYAGWSRRSGRCAVVLGNAQVPPGLDDIGLHLIDPESPLAVLPRQAPIDPARLDAYVGLYSVAPVFMLDVARLGDRLFVQTTGQRPMEIFYGGDGRFFFKQVNARLAFDFDSKGRAVSLVLDQNGRDLHGLRVQ